VKSNTILFVGNLSVFVNIDLPDRFFSFTQLVEFLLVKLKPFFSLSIQDPT
jgi:hypothetical protein